MGLAGPPLYESIAVVEDQTLAAKVPKLVMGFEWLKWFGSLVLSVDQAPSRQGQTSLSAQEASIGVTSIPVPSVAPGMWRISYYVRITRAATTSSSLAVTIQWIDGGVTLSYTGSALTGNTTGTYQCATLVIRSDHATPISYSTVYGSVGATGMQYSMDVIAESLAPDGV